ncbi:phage holin family protein [Streptomyces sp. H27-C3]|uniref:phage holin family protein n=1 Tax=Streptomyces sp. H27-C3 TaxID=3046305 RepID=UPI0032D98799
MTQSAEPSAAELVKRASEQLADLVREEHGLTRTEMKEKGKRAGLGGGLYGGAGLTAFLALWTGPVAGRALSPVGRTPGTDRTGSWHRPHSPDSP